MSKLKTIFDYLQLLFPDPKTELEFKNEFQLIIAVILSAQTTDIQVNKVTKSLFQEIKTPQNIITIGEEKLTKSISSINYYKNKAKYIFQLSKIIIDEKKIKEIGISTYKTYQENDQIYFVPDTIESLQKLPGIGEKTAKVVGQTIFGLEVIAVDTHVHRVSNRLGLVNTKTPEQTSKLLEKVIPKKYKTIAHHSIILFGRYYCTARKPKCDDCQLKSICQRYKSNKL